MGTVDRDRIRRMASAGYSAREIARELVISHTRASQVLAQDGRIDVHASIRAPSKDTLIIKTNDAQIAGVAIKRALKRAGITLEE
jgi:hypothetical protein